MNGIHNNTVCIHYVSHWYTGTLQANVLLHPSISIMLYYTMLCYAMVILYIEVGRVGSLAQIFTQRNQIVVVVYSHTYIIGSEYTHTSIVSISSMSYKYKFPSLCAQLPMV